VEELSAAAAAVATAAVAAGAAAAAVSTKPSVNGAPSVRGLREVGIAVVAVQVNGEAAAVAVRTGAAYGESTAPKSAAAAAAAEKAPTRRLATSSIAAFPVAATARRLEEAEAAATDLVRAVDAAPAVLEECNAPVPGDAPAPDVDLTLDPGPSRAPAGTPDGTVATAAGATPVPSPAWTRAPAEATTAAAAGTAGVPLPRVRRFLVTDEDGGRGCTVKCVPEMAAEGLQSAFWPWREC